MDGISPEDYLTNFKSGLEHAVAIKSATIMRKVLTESASKMSEVEVDENTDVNDFTESFYNIWDNIEIPTSLQEQKLVPVLKKPAIPQSIIDKVTSAGKLLEQKKSIVKELNNINKRTKNKKPLTKEVTNAFYKVLYMAKKEYLYDSLVNIKNWLTHMGDEANTMLLYKSSDPDGSPRGGNGKTFTTDLIIPAAERIGLPATPTSMPDWSDSEISEVYAKYYIGVTQEARVNFARTPGYSILDHSYYSVKRKFEKSYMAKSIINMIGTTNENFSKVEQPTRRREAPVECNEYFNAIEYMEKGGVLPTKEEIIEAWVYLLTHDLSTLNLKKLTEKVIPRGYINILWNIADSVDFFKDQMFLMDIEDLLGDKRVSLSTLSEVLIYCGAKKIKNGKHGERLDGYTLFDMTDFKVPEVWGSKEQNLEEIKKAIEEIVDSDNLPDHDPEPTKKEEEDLDSIIEDSELFEEDDLDLDVEEPEIFDFIDEPTLAYKDQYDAKGEEISEATEDFQFGTINPIKTYSLAEDLDLDVETATPEQLERHPKQRKDENVSSMRNFLFECDETPLEEQKQIIRKLVNKKVLNRVVFSGNKSFHCRITINQEPESIEQYKWIWSKLNEEYFDGKADKACANPSRLTRKPNGVRILKDGRKVVQKLCYNKPNIIDSSKLNEEWKKVKKGRELSSKLFEKSYTKRTPNNENILDELYEVEGKYGDRETYQRALSLALNDGTLSYDEAASAVCFIMSLGFTAEEVKEQIEFGKWNFTTSYLKKLANEAA